MPDASNTPPLSKTPQATRRVRDVRLDFFRGIGMFIIFISHLPGNPWSAWIPARFGFSDATEIFVFCSGMASAIAFGAVFKYQSFWLGTARVLFRCWQVYWAHIGSFVAITAVMIAMNTWLGVGDKYVAKLNLIPFLVTDTSTNLLGFMTLTYVPNFFDILPMYLVILAMMPIVMALSYLNRWAVFAFIVGLYVVSTMGYLQLPAEPWSDRKWFFHPFAWQLVFFTGFAFIMKWLPAPPINRTLVIAAITVIAVMFPLKYFPLYQWLDPNFAWREDILYAMGKTTFRPLRYIHFLALAYLAYAAAGEGGKRLSQGWLTNICRKVGQQALSTFLVGLLLSRLGGIILDYWGKDFLTVAIVNLTGCALLVATAYIVGWFKSAPWANSTKTHRT
ncbi:MAG: OpgC family protein [Hyphomicrobiaceae bacterium]